MIKFSYRYRINVMRQSGLVTTSEVASSNIRNFDSGNSPSVRGAEEHPLDMLPVSPRNLSDDQFSATVTAIVSAFGDPTRRNIYLFTRESNGVTASEVATRFRLHPNVARHHLDKLVAGGYLDVFIDRKITTGAGRPSKQYRGSKNPSTVETAPHTDELLSFLLTSALERLPEDEIECMANEVGEKYGKLLASHMTPIDSQLSLHQAMRAIADALTAHGFAARSETSGSHRDTVVSDCCPFGSIALSHPVLCVVDRGIVRGMLTTLYGGPVPIKMSSKARGDDNCTVSV
ncbi:MAG: helix-turn-helix domain-containing protein [Acidimicrobiaceae bacterium]|nr:helix-turn-helix domain-containing protein [Acidimicrobiaceae bacterium]